MISIKFVLHNTDLRLVLVKNYVNDYVLKLYVNIQKKHTHNTKDLASLPSLFFLLQVKFISCKKKMTHKTHQICIFHNWHRC